MCTIFNSQLMHNTSYVINRWNISVIILTFFTLNFCLIGTTGEQFDSSFSTATVDTTGVSNNLSVLLTIVASMGLSLPIIGVVIIIIFKKYIWPYFAGVNKKHSKCTL